MTDIILSGCCGVMGKNIAQCIEKKDDCRIVAGIDIKSDDNSPFPIYKNADNFTGKAVNSQIDRMSLRGLALDDLHYVFG